MISPAHAINDQDRRSFLESDGKCRLAQFARRHADRQDGHILETAQTGIRRTYAMPAPEILSVSTKPSHRYRCSRKLRGRDHRLRAFNDTFLYVARLLDPKWSPAQPNEATVAEYAELESRRLGIQVNFALMFAVIALTILMASVLIGLNFATGCGADPKPDGAANTVSTGDLNVQVRCTGRRRSGATRRDLNKMTQELRTSATN